MKLSIIIPTFNEEKHLPPLLSSLYAQKFTDYEVIIVDAGSTDGTRNVADRFKKLMHLSFILEKRKGIGRARNKGAKKANGSMLLFLDADVILPRNFLLKCLAEIAASGASIATCNMVPITSRLTDKLLHKIANKIYEISQYIYPVAPGFCIFVKSNLHKKIHGFDEKVVLNEDHDYVIRASKYGDFRVLESVPILVSVRRLEKEGRARLVGKYMLASVYTVLGKKIRKPIFKYEFGHWNPAKK